MRRIVCSLLLLFTAANVRAAVAEETWFSVHLDGRKIGHMLHLRSVEAGQRVVSEQALVLTLERSGESLRITTRERSWETLDGLPLAFESEIDSAGSVARVHGTLREDGVLELTTEAQGESGRQQMPWPAGALLAEGQALASRRAGVAPGTSYEMIAFDPGSLQPVHIRTVVGATGEVEIHGQREQLVLLEQTLDFGGITSKTRSWVAPSDLALRRLRLPAIGLELEMLACDRACALAPDQPTDVLAQTLVGSPRSLPRRELKRAMTYRLRLAHGDPKALGVVPGQTLAARVGAGEFDLRIDPGGDAAVPPVAADVASTRWLQADDATLLALAQRVTADARDDADRVIRLERFVRGHIRTKSLRVGYASALEVMRQREGDCTEHAVLLAAMVRALGIPARVANGIAYTASFGARQHVFVPHAWVQAWVDGGWHGYDAALARFDTGHIAFNVGDGDPFRFYGGVDLLGGIEILEAQRVATTTRRGQSQ